MKRPDPRRLCLAGHAGVSSGGVRWVARGGRGAVRSPREVPASGVRRLRSKIRLGGRLNAVRDAARFLVLRDSAITGEGRRGALRAQEGAYAAPVRVREPSPRVGSGVCPGASPMAVLPPVESP